VKSVLITLGIKSGNYTELHREGTELHRGNPENYKQMNKKYQWFSVVLCGTLCNKKTVLIGTKLFFQEKSKKNKIFPQISIHFKFSLLKSKNDEKKILSKDYKIFGQATKNGLEKYLN